jgi:hypothetical protein
MKSYSKLASAKNRRKRALARLQAQLKSGQKPVPGMPSDVFVLLTDKDKERIQNEIGILETRI